MTRERWRASGGYVLGRRGGRRPRWGQRGYGSMARLWGGRRFYGESTAVFFCGCASLRRRECCRSFTRCSGWGLGRGGLCGWRCFRGGLRAGEAAHQRQGDEVDRADKQRREQAPGDDGVEGGGAELVEELARVVPEEFAHADDVEGDPGGAEECLPEADTGVHHGDMRGPEELVDEVDEWLVELEEDGGGDAEGGGGAEDGKEGAGAADGEGEGDFARGNALGELREDRVEDAALPERAGKRRGGGDGRR